MVDKDRSEGAAKGIGGRIKEMIGRITGDEKMKRAGQTDQVKGKVQNTVGGVKDAIKGRP